MSGQHQNGMPTILSPFENTARGERASRDAAKGELLRPACQTWVEYAETSAAGFAVP